MASVVDGREADAASADSCTDVPSLSPQLLPGDSPLARQMAPLNGRGGSRGPAGREGLPGGTDALAVQGADPLGPEPGWLVRSGKHSARPRLGACAGAGREATGRARGQDWALQLDPAGSKLSQGLGTAGQGQASGLEGQVSLPPPPPAVDGTLFVARAPGSSWRSGPLASLPWGLSHPRPPPPSPHPQQHLIYTHGLASRGCPVVQRVCQPCHSPASFPRPPASQDMVTL